MKTLIKNIHTLATFDKQGTELKDAWVSIENNVIRGVGSGNLPKDAFDKVIDAKTCLSFLVCEYASPLLPITF